MGSQEVLASGSADKTTKLWRAEGDSYACAHTFRCARRAGLGWAVRCWAGLGWAANLTRCGARELPLAAPLPCRGRPASRSAAAVDVHCPRPPAPAASLLQRAERRRGVGVRAPHLGLPHLRGVRRHVGLLRRRAGGVRHPGGRPDMGSRPADARAFGAFLGTVSLWAGVRVSRRASQRTCVSTTVWPPPLPAAPGGGRRGGGWRRLQLRGTSPRRPHPVHRHRRRRRPHLGDTHAKGGGAGATVVLPAVARLPARLDRPAAVSTRAGLPAAARLLEPPRPPSLRSPQRFPCPSSERGQV